MSDTNPSDQDIERLLNAAGERVEPPGEVRERVYGEVLAIWETLPETQPDAPVETMRVLNRRWLSLAAAFCGVGVALILWLSAPPAGIVPAGHIAYATGVYLIDGQRTTGIGSVVLPGARLQTPGDSKLTLELASGIQLSLDSQTHTVIGGADDARIESGRLYVDAGDVEAQVRIDAATSAIVDIGTQYAVEVHGDDVLVVMREGAAQVTTGNARVALATAQGRGDTLRLTGGEVAERSTLATNDDYWTWRREARAPLTLPGTSVHDYLVWMARDMGHDLVFARDAVRQRAQLESIGPGDRTSDDETLVEVMETTSFRVTQAGPHTWVVDFRS